MRGSKLHSQYSGNHQFRKTQMRKLPQYRRELMELERYIEIVKLITFLVILQNIKTLKSVLNCAISKRGNDKSPQ